MNLDLPEEITNKLKNYFEKLLVEYYGENVQWTSFGKGFPTYQLKVLKDVQSWPNSDDENVRKIMTKVIDKEFTISLLAKKEE